MIVPVFNGIEHLPRFFASLAAAIPDGAQVIVVDDCSVQPVLEAVPDLPRAASVVCLRNDVNLGNAGAVNRGFVAATGDIIVQLNSDLVLDARCVSAMVDVIESGPSDIGIVGSKLIYPTTGRIQSVGMCFGFHSKRHIYRHLPADDPLGSNTREVQVVTGATAAMTRRVLDELGPLDDELYNHNLDIDHCLRATKRGLRNFMCADSVAYHWRNRSGPIRYARVEAAEAAFWGKWAGGYNVDLGRFIDEALDAVLARAPRLVSVDFTILDLSRSADQMIAIERLGARWGGVAASVQPFRQMSNDAERLLLPLTLPHWTSQDPSPYIYLVDSHRELEENAMWFAQRRSIATDELVVDLNASVCTTSEFAAWQSASSDAP